jgi:hypothetical protein
MGIATGVSRKTAMIWVTETRLSCYEGLLLTQ